MSTRQVYSRMPYDPQGGPWLPDATLAGQVQEFSLPPEDETPSAGFGQCPADAPLDAPSKNPVAIEECAKAIAAWVFDTYCKLVKHRLQVYNKYRREINNGSSSPLILGRYRRACRLACEQLLRRDLPEIGYDWCFYDLALPIFDLEVRCELVSPETELVKKVTITGVVEVRQRRHPEDASLVDLAGMKIMTQPDWSSSSSSSSSSEFDPG